MNQGPNTNLAGSNWNFESSLYAITSAGSLTVAHPFRSAPILVTAKLVCQVAEAGFSIGNTINLPISGGDGNTAADVGVVVTTDDDNIYATFGARPASFEILNKSTGQSASLTNANWQICFDAIG
jgi:hypothetical protein